MTTSPVREPAVITAVSPVTDRVVYLEFADGARGHVDLRPWLVGPVFEEIAATDEAFESILVDEFGSVSWPNGADLDADVLRLSLVPLQVQSQPRMRVQFGATAAFDELFIGGVGSVGSGYTYGRLVRVDSLFTVPDDLSGLGWASDHVEDS
jgi:hypothetical protein